MIKGWGRRVEDILSGSGPDDLGSNPSDSVQTFLERKFDQRNKIFSFTGFLFVKKKCMKATVRRSRIGGEIDAPPSKSYTHRAIAIASLGTRTRSELIAPLFSEDTDAEITFFKEPTEVKVVNLLEYEDEEVSKGLQIEGKRIKLNVKPFEIVTLRLRF